MPKNKIAFVADVHINNFQSHGGKLTAGINRRCEITLNTLRAAYVAAKRAGCDEFYVLGDLFHVHKPLPQVITAVQKILQSDTAPHVGLLVGTHDPMSFDLGDHALGPFQHCQIFDQPSVAKFHDVPIFFIPPQPGPACEWLPQAMEQLADRLPASYKSDAILCLHLGISDENTAGFLRGDDAIDIKSLFTLCNKFRIRTVFAGHWHQKKVWNDKDTTIIQLGALCPTGWSDSGDTGYGTLAIWENQNISFSHFPGPRFLKGLVDNAESKDFADLLTSAKTLHTVGCSVFLRVSAPEQAVKSIHTVLSNNSELLAGFEVHPDKMEMTVAARKAAASARSATTLDEAIDKFVTHMPLKDGVDRKRVAELTKKYLEM